MFIFFVGQHLLDDIALLYCTVQTLCYHQFCIIFFPFGNEVKVFLCFYGKVLPTFGVDLIFRLSYNIYTLYNE